jgi:serine-type D-Ala-D-Ala carboxypeptidase (penicillin-binding protein 5/6)
MTAESATGPRKTPPRVGWPSFLLSAVVVALLAGVAGTAAARYTSPIPPLVPSSSFSTTLTAANSGTAIPWPTRGQAALAFDGSAAVAAYNPSGKAAAIGSTAKLMTALLILEHHPLEDGQTGPSVSVSAEDVRHYQEALLQDQSVVEVRPDETLSEFDLIQGLLIPSANNFADMLAAWDAGSVSAFVATMNTRAQALGMTRTHFDDASGLSPATVSTADDLLVVVRAVMANQVLATIVAEREAMLPVAGKVENTNLLLDQPGVVGVKTGQTDEAGGCVAFAATVQNGSDTRTVFGVVLGQQDLLEAFSAAKALIEAAPAQIATTSVVVRGQSIGTYRAPWSGPDPVVAANDLDLTTFAGAVISVDVLLGDLDAPVAAGEKVGTLTATSGDQRATVDLIAGGKLAGPSVWWRMIRN